MMKQLALANFVGQFDVDWPSLLAMSSTVLIPVVIVFVFFQKYLVEAMMQSGRK